MTDVLEYSARTAEDSMAVAAAVPVLPAPAGVVRPARAGAPALLVGASLSAAAGAIHLVMVPSHAGESLAEGLMFALAGWQQLVAAWLFAVRPTRRLLLPVAAANAVFVAAWVWSRTAGLPVGARPGHPESVGFVDLTTVALEVALIGWCLVVWARPAIGRSAGRAGNWLGAVLAIGAFAAATVAIASPSARNHAAHSHGEVTTAGAAHTHDDGTAATTAAAAPHDHATDTTTVDDKGLSALSNGHHHVIGPEEPLDPASRAELSRQIAITQEVAAQYPTIAAAEAAGYRRAGPYSPGLGTHYIRANAEGLNFDGVMDDPDLRSPLAMIYAGSDPSSPIAGFMYYSMSATEPNGFAGPNDHWHYHTNTCLKPGADGGTDAPFGADTDVPASLCTQVGGTVLEQTQWMVHVWSVPGWESQQGLFGEVNPALSCPDGTYYQLPMEQWIDHPLNVCAS
jgi:hypothetical protein